MVYYDQPQRSQIVLEIFPKDGISVSGEKKWPNVIERWWITECLSVNTHTFFKQWCTPIHQWLPRDVTIHCLHVWAPSSHSQCGQFNGAAQLAACSSCEDIFVGHPVLAYVLIPSGTSGAFCLHCTQRTPSAFLSFTLFFLDTILGWWTIANVWELLDLWGFPTYIHFCSLIIWLQIELRPIAVILESFYLAIHSQGNIFTICLISLFHLLHSLATTGMYIYTWE